VSEIPEPGRGALVLEDEELAGEHELWTDDPGSDHAGWFCVRTDPFPCPAAGCTFLAEFMTAAHLILVWQEKDDPNLLRHAARAKQVGRNPRVVRACVRTERLVLRLGGVGPPGSRRSPRIAASALAQMLGPPGRGPQETR
jgi:hypothetical protein